MNYLDLCRKVVRRGAIAGGDRKPETVQNQTGRMRLVTEWVSDANKEIQAYRNDFSFRVRSVDFALGAGQQSFRPSDTHADIESFNELSVSVRDAKESKNIPPINWLVFRSQDPLPSTGLPDAFSIDTAGDVHLSPAPIGVCIVNAECRLKPQELTDDDDVSYIPEGYHDAIFYRALMYFYEYDESPLYASAEAQYTEWLERLVSATTPLSDWHRTQSGEALMVMSVE